MTAILAGGDPPTHGIPRKILMEASRLIACDGAWRVAMALGRTPDAVVGDGDSVCADDIAEMARCGISFLRETEQDTNDLCKAFRYAAKHDDSLAILGATGKREDHSLGNIFHLIDFAESVPDISIITDYGRFEPVMPPGKMWSGVDAGQPVSVFAPIPGTHLTSEGLVWPLDGVKCDALWKGTLNRTQGKEFAIGTDRAAIAYLPHPPHLPTDGGFGIFPICQPFIHKKGQNADTRGIS